jgi:hypothetical protein
MALGDDATALPRRRELSDLPPSVREQAMAKWAVLRPHLQEGAALACAAQEAGVPLGTAQRWLTRYRTDGVAGLARVGRVDRGRRRLPDQLVALIEGLTLRRPPPSTAATHRQIAELALVQGWPTPSYSTVYAIVTAIDPGLATLAHDGAKRYREVYDLIHRRTTARPNGIWQADHTLIDLWIRTPTGTPAQPETRRCSGSSPCSPATRCGSDCKTGAGTPSRPPACRGACGLVSGTTTDAVAGLPGCSLSPAINRSRDEADLDSPTYYSLILPYGRPLTPRCSLVQPRTPSHPSALAPPRHCRDRGMKYAPTVRQDSRSYGEESSRGVIADHGSEVERLRARPDHAHPGAAVTHVDHRSPPLCFRQDARRTVTSAPSGSS